jgi:hypothetical protein
MSKLIKLCALKKVQFIYVNYTFKNKSEPL